MLEVALLQAGSTIQPPVEPATTADTLRTIGDVGITLAAVKAAGMVGRRAVMGHFLPPDVDVSAARRERDPWAVLALAALYAAATALTTAAVYLAATLPLALAWAGACAFVAAVLALSAARDAEPVSDIRLLAQRGESDGATE